MPEGAKFISFHLTTHSRERVRINVLNTSHDDKEQTFAKGNPRFNMEGRSCDVKERAAVSGTTACLSGLWRRRSFMASVHCQSVRNFFPRCWRIIAGTNHVTSDAICSRDDNGFLELSGFCVLMLNLAVLMVITRFPEKYYPGPLSLRFSKGNDYPQASAQIQNCRPYSEDVDLRFGQSAVSAAKSNGRIF